MHPTPAIVSSTFARLVIGRDVIEMEARSLPTPTCGCKFVDNWSHDPCKVLRIHFMACRIEIHRVIRLPLKRIVDMSFFRQRSGVRHRSFVSWRKPLPLVDAVPGDIDLVPSLQLRGRLIQLNLHEHRFGSCNKCLLLSFVELAIPPSPNTARNGEATLGFLGGKSLNPYNGKI
jgi:hypothetical protein